MSRLPFFADVTLCRWMFLNVSEESGVSCLFVPLNLEGEDTALLIN
jgi:hypothetical protein